MIIETMNLSKMYGQQIGCHEICLSVPEGQIFGLLGPNGAGKSTLVKTLVGLLWPTSGSATLLGRPLGDVSVRRHIGFLPENFRYHDWLSARELLTFHGRLFGLDSPSIDRRIPEVLDTVNLHGVEKKQVRAFSKGMQQRIGMAIALMPDPKLVFLDEPTSALDPIGRREVREVLGQLRQVGKTVFLNSHLLSEVEMLCDEIAVINKGRVVASGPVDRLLGERLHLEMVASGLTPAILDGLRAICSDLKVEGTKVVGTVSRREDMAKAAAAVVLGGGQLYELDSKRPSLEDLFVRLIAGKPHTQHSARSAGDAGNAEDRPC